MFGELASTTKVVIGGTQAISAMHSSSLEVMIGHPHALLTKKVTAQQRRDCVDQVLASRMLPAAVQTLTDAIEVL